MYLHYAQSRVQVFVATQRQSCIETDAHEIFCDPKSFHLQGVKIWRVDTSFGVILGTRNSKSRGPSCVRISS
ncbi:hypothetical protein TNCV_2539211 [Trichonephila clavipes]|nr:hypothetical protein TNCV_2539211 [Trichonephila clavipes]